MAEDGAHSFLSYVVLRGTSGSMVEGVPMFGGIIPGALKTLYFLRHTVTTAH